MKRLTLGRLQVYIEPRDIWVGAYVSTDAVYVCPLPLVVLRWERAMKLAPDGRPATMFREIDFSERDVTGGYLPMLDSDWLDVRECMENDGPSPVADTSANCECGWALSVHRVEPEVESDGYCSCPPVAYPPASYARDCGVAGHRRLAGGVA